MKLGQDTEELHRYGRGDNQEAHCEDDQGTEFLPGTEDLVDEVFEEGGYANQPDDAEHLNGVEIEFIGCFHHGKGYRFIT